MSKKLTTEEFINKCKIIHDNKYDYSLVIYTGSSHKIDIICSEHGEFKQSALNHLYMKNGCPKCSKTLKHTKETFIEKAKEKHGNKYDYSLVEYNGSVDKIKIICSEHGFFKQRVNNHLNGQGCSYCGLKNISEFKLLESIRKEFIVEKIESQYTPDWLKSEKQGTQSFDIYFPDYNIAIEYQGVQHFKPIKWFGGAEKFDYMKILDQRKRNLCLMNDCKLLYFTYKEKEIPTEYPYEVYTNKQLLINDIKKYIKNGK